VLDFELKLFFEDLDKNDINYCLWKGCADLEESLNGRGDLDILIDPDSVDKLLQIISHHNIFLGISNKYRVDASIYDLFLLSVESSRLIHIQMYTRIVFGKKSVSYDFSYEYVMWENLLLKKKRHDVYPIYVLDQQIENFFNVIRYSLKYGKNPSTLVDFDKHANLFKVDEKNLRFMTSKLCDHTKLIEKFSHDDNMILFREIYKKIDEDPGALNLIKRNRLNNHVIGLLIKFFQLQKKIKYFRYNPHRRLLKGVGLIFIGADGSGKSTQISRVVQIFQNKFNTVSLYMGSGKGETSLAINLFKFIRNFTVRKKNFDVSKGSKGSNEAKLSTKKGYALAIYAVTLAYSKKRKFKKLKLFLSYGAIVVCDRFPQSSVLGSNDGPLLYRYMQSSSLIFRILAKWELNIYRSISLQNMNTKVIKLIPSDLELVYKRRKDEMEWNNFKNRHVEIKKIDNLGSFDPISIDAALPLCEVNKKVDEGILSFVSKK